jgi:hypothetical protein
MGSFKRPRVFHPLDLEIMDRVYETVWAHLEACEVRFWHIADIEDRPATCLLSGVKRTSLIRFSMSANDPKRTLSHRP